MDAQMRRRWSIGLWSEIAVDSAFMEGRSEEARANGEKRPECLKMGWTTNSLAVRFEVGLMLRFASLPEWEAAEDGVR